MLVLAIAACSSNQERGVLDRIEFDEDEVGCARATGSLAVGGNPFTSTDVTLVVVKKKVTYTDADGAHHEVEVPDC